MAFVLPSNPGLLLLLVALAGLLAGLVILIAGRLGVRLAGRSEAAWDDAIARQVPAPLSLLAGILAAGAALASIDERLDPELARHARGILVIVLLAGGAWVFARMLRMSLAKVSAKKARLRPAARVTERIVSAVIYAIAFLTVLSEYGISVTPLLTGLGLAALAVGLALQETLANFLAGLWMQTEQPLSPGHYVRIEEQKVEGFVERVGWRTTRIRVLAGNLVVLPNSRVAQATVIDYSMPDATISVVMSFRFPFDEDPQRIMNLLVEEAKEAAKTTPGLLADPAPFANATPGVGEYGIGYSLIIKVREFVDQWTAQTAVTTRVWHRFQKEGIQFLYPTRVNLQADGTAFAPSTEVLSRQVLMPQGRDPREIEAQRAKEDIALKAVERASRRNPDDLAAPGGA